MTEQEILSQTEKVTGYFWPDEQKQLYSQVINLNKDAIVVEVGCLAGKSGSLLASVARENGFKLYLIDNWADGNDANGIPFKKMFWDKMSELDLITSFTFIELPSVEAARQFADNSISVLHLDANHTYEPSKADLKAWVPKLKHGGTMCFHDYMNDVFVDGIKKAVDEAGLEMIIVTNSLGVLRVP
jgi:predicted O-methyltransferase YrrM